MADSPTAPTPSPAPPSTRALRRALRGGVVALAGLALLVALLDLGARTLHDLDTPRWGHLAREMLRSGQWLVPVRDGQIYAFKPPLYLWMVALTSKWAGEVTPFLVRLPSALGFVVLVLVTAWWAAWRSRSRLTGLFAGLLCLSSVELAWLGREGRLDMMGAALALWGAALVDRVATGRGSRRTPLVAGILLGLALLVKGPVLLLPACAVLLLAGRRGGLGERWRRARPGVVFGAAAAVALCWFVPATIAAGPGYAKTLLFEQGAERLAGEGNHLQSGLYYLAMIPASYLVWGLFALAAAVASFVPRWARSLRSLRGPVLAGGVLLLFFSLVPTKHVRYLAPVYPLLLLGLAAWVRGLVRAAARRGTSTRRLPFETQVLALSGVGVAGAGLASLRFTWALLVPALGFLALALHARRPPPEGTPGATAPARRALVVLLAAAFAVSAFVLLRPRYRLRKNVRLNEEVAAHLPPGTPVWTLTPVHPEDLFLGAPGALLARTPADLPRRDAPWVLVCEGADRARVEETVSGEVRPLFATDPDEPRVVLEIEPGVARPPAPDR